MRFFAFLFNFVLCLGLFLLALLVMPSGKHNIQLSAVPLSGASLTEALLIGSIGGFVAMVLALRKSRAARLPMVLWNLLVLVLLISTPLRPSFTFAGRDQLMEGLYAVIAAALALCGSWLQWRVKRPPSRRLSSNARY